ncbi:hypothetical protein [Schinkia azotoformans]|uniref:hypothetical protein n=1 Tax=Schinkia azotoformans TaxID=1454 RepID=UPI003D2A1984
MNKCNHDRESKYSTLVFMGFESDEDLNDWSVYRCELCGKPIEFYPLPIEK